MKEQEKIEEKEIELYHRLADVSLRTSATILTIIFAYTFAVGQLPSSIKFFIIGISVVMLFSIAFSAIALYGLRQDIRLVKGLTIISTVLMIGAIALMVLLLAWILGTMPSL